MAKRKRKGGRRKAPKPGLLEAFIDAAAIAEATGGAYLKNVATDRLRTDLKAMGLSTGTRVGDAILMVLVGRVVHKETNKLGVNPAYGPVRLF